jgi:hypothetical protein
MEETQEKLGGKAADAVIQSLQSHFHLWYIGIAISVVGFGLIVYKILEEKFARKITQPDIKKITEEVTIERRDLPIRCRYPRCKEKNERDGKSFPCNFS